ncbi:ectoine/hydroxyectoine ABC transporter permease subunit EhuC [Varunaivibrio sulfuroxidans]|uniref:Amino acid ABC transporter membrane protein 1 (PAAT family) n=1 Tax=Varunaivibrio sulfuroxidans TaxID=1773489 RepID=A0A4R3J5I4_9PROT|nr:ectoine/hydroxyectoine ABC transporter permease subunit EhuC [Varunaivibrio sulfuroxidans]TCS60542.1 amino acid ABC transporter membrane protein 1 (PAAT family) [Varunaivibrio sulfuroxidans]WES30032.1 ectoine/hydroxyectoine ABC transporter permease subunit EhuC [Varunaivibrio sulfuroxidans]
MNNGHSRLAVVTIVGFAVGMGVLNFTGLRQFVPGLLQGAWVSVQITSGGALLAVVAALTAAIAKVYGPAPIRWLAITYIEIFRGTSALVQLFWLFFVLPQFGITLPPFAVGITALGLNIGAYGAEVIRGAIAAVPRGQWEASRALNLTRMQALRRIILPQAFVAMIPPWGNLFIELLKATALVSLITLPDLAFKAQEMNQSTLKTTQIFTIVLAMYLGISLLITSAMKALDHRVSRGLRQTRTQR